MLKTRVMELVEKYPYIISLDSNIFISRIRNQKTLSVDKLNKLFKLPLKMMDTLKKLHKDSKYIITSTVFAEVVSNYRMLLDNGELTDVEKSNCLESLESFLNTSFGAVDKEDNKWLSTFHKFETEKIHKNTKKSGSFSPQDTKDLKIIFESMYYGANSFITKENLEKKTFWRRGVHEAQAYLSIYSPFNLFNEGAEVLNQLVKSNIEKFIDRNKQPASLQPGNNEVKIIWSHESYATRVLYLFPNLKEILEEVLNQIPLTKIVKPDFINWVSSEHFPNLMYQFVSANDEPEYHHMTHSKIINFKDGDAALISIRFYFQIKLSITKENKITYNTFMKVSPPKVHYYKKTLYQTLFSWTGHDFTISSITFMDKHRLTLGKEKIENQPVIFDQYEMNGKKLIKKEINLLDKTIERNKIIDSIKLFEDTEDMNNNLPAIKKLIK